MLSAPTFHPLYYPDSQLIMISALQHLVFCERQFALIHIEQIWEENYLTAEGRVLHESVDQPCSESRRDIRQATAVRIRSSCLGLSGVMDMLEFHRLNSPDPANHKTIAVPLPRSRDLWVPFPVEYKRGKPKSHRADEIQLCAQAICLEEMLNITIHQGALFYGQPRRRTEVFFDDELRCLVATAAHRAHELIQHGITPPAIDEPKCKSCSLLALCQPKIVRRLSASQWLSREIEDILQ